MKANRLIKIRLQILIVLFILKYMWLSYNTSRIHNIINGNIDFLKCILEKCIFVCVVLNTIGLCYWDIILDYQVRPKLIT